MSSGGKGKQTVGYRYYLGTDFAWCHGPVDHMQNMYLDNKALNISISDTDGGSAYIARPDLFGEAEGGIQGRVKLYDGRETQEKDAYLVDKLGENIPAYRGVTRTVHDGGKDDEGRAMYVGNNPYLKKIKAKFQRIFKRIVNGQVTDQWQKDIAGITPLSGAGVSVSGGNLANVSLLIQIDLSSVTNGFTGSAGTISGTQDIETAKATAIGILEYIRDNATYDRPNEPLVRVYNIGDPATADNSINPSEFEESGLDIGVAFFRHTAGGVINEEVTGGIFESWPNSGYVDSPLVTDSPEGAEAFGLEPTNAPIPTTAERNNGVYDGLYNWPQRGYLMFDSATSNDIDKLIAFVQQMEVVPDNQPISSSTERGKVEDNVEDAFDGLSTDRRRAHILISDLAGSDTVAQTTGSKNDIDTVLYAGTGIPINAVYYSTNTTDTKQAKLSALTSWTDISSDSVEFGGGWEFLTQDVVITGGAEYMTVFDGPVTEAEAFAAITIPSGDKTDTPFALPPNSSRLWYFGPFMSTGLYAGRYDPEYAYVRDTTGTTTVTINGNDMFEQLQYEMVDEDSSSNLTTNIPPINNPNVANAIAILDPFAATTCYDMNPAHIIRECLTDQNWGLGLAESEVDETSFAAAAQTLYDESFGLSLVWRREEPVEEFINLILNHIDATLYVNRTEGKWTLKLIRDDYVDASLTEYTDADVVSWDTISIKGPAELVNSVTLKHNSRELRGPASLTVKNLAQVQQLGSIVSSTVNYPGIWDPILAGRVAQRDLITLSSALISGNITVTRKGYNLNPGDVFKLTSSRYGLNELICRVVEVNLGDGRSNEISVKFTQDKFALATDVSFDTVDLPSTEWEDLNQVPVVTQNRLVTEEPYYLFVARVGEANATDIETNDPDVGYVSYVAIPPVSSAVSAVVAVDDDADLVFENVDTVNYTAYGVTTNEFFPEADDKTLTVSSFNNFTSIVAGDLLQIGDEIMVVESVDSSTQLTVGRGCLDTVPAYHDSGKYVYFLTDYVGTYGKEYTASDAVRVRLKTETGGGVLDTAKAPIDTVTMDSRITRPYTVGKLQLDGAYKDIWDTSSGATVTATWTHRDRTLQTGASVTTFEDDSIGPETGSDYTITAVAYAFDDGEEITSIGNLFSVDKNQNTSHVISSDAYTPTSESTESWSAVGVRVTNTRGTSPGYENWQTAEVLSYYPVTPTESETLDGIWIDANVFASMYEDAEATTPITYDGDPIGAISSQRDY